MQSSPLPNPGERHRHEVVAARRIIVVSLAALVLMFILPRISLAQGAQPLGLVVGTSIAEVSLDLESTFVDRGDPLGYTIGITNLAGTTNFVGLLLSLVLPGGDALQLGGPLPLDMSFGRLTVSNGLPTGALAAGDYALVVQLLADDGGAVAQLDFAAAGFTVQ